MTRSYAERSTLHPPTSVPARLWRCLWRQSSRSPTCPDTPRLDGQRALVTGGGRGIGLDTVRGLASRGARVLSASRRAPAADVPARFVPLDLGDLASLTKALALLDVALGGEPIDVLVANAGLWPGRFSRSAQGHEIAFATNVLGHHALTRGLQERGLLAPDARVVIVTGDIYVMAEECTPDFEYGGAFGAEQAYCRSKLGNLWQMRELARRCRGLRVHAVHPGVIASELAGSSGGLAGALKRAALLSTRAGAQTSLFCATQPGLESGSYYHNTLGRVELAEGDPAADAGRAARLWDQLEALSAPFRGVAAAS